MFNQDTLNIDLGLLKIITTSVNKGEVISKDASTQEDTKNIQPGMPLLI